MAIDPYTLEQAEEDIAALRGQVDLMTEIIQTAVISASATITGPDSSVWGATGIVAEAWRYVGAGGQPAFGAGWSNTGGVWATLAFRLVTCPPASVLIMGTVTNATPANAAAIFTLPAGYRPASQQRFCENENETVLHGVDIHTDGTVVSSAGSAGTGTYFLFSIHSLDI